MTKQAAGTRTRNHILDTAERLISERGYHGTSLRDIGQEVGIANASLLYHFPSKDHLYQAVMERMTTSMDALIADIESSEGDGEHRLALVAQGLNGWLGADPRRARLLLRGLMDGEDTAKARRSGAIGQILQRLAKYLEGGAKGTGMKKVDLDQLMIRILGAGLLYSLHGPANKTPDFTKQETRLLTRTLGKTKNK